MDFSEGIRRGRNRGVLWMVKNIYIYIYVCVCVCVVYKVSEALGWFEFLI